MSWVHEQPDLRGELGVAWRATDALHAAVMERGQSQASHAAALDVWVVNMPNVHMLAWWVVQAIHLRDIAGQELEPMRLFPEATHEVRAHALDPDGCPPSLFKALPMLRPPNVYFQIETRSLPDVADHQVARTLQFAIENVLAGRLQIEDQLITTSEELVQAQSTARSLIWADAFRHTIRHLDEGKHE